MAGGVTLYGPCVSGCGPSARWFAEMIVDLSRNVAALEGAPFHVPGSTDLVYGDPVITYTSRWGITADGVAYYDPDGAVPGEDAILSVDDGVLSLTKLDATP